MSNWSPTYEAVCDICGETQEVSNYGDWACRKCGQGYTYDECHQIRLADSQWALLRNPPRWIPIEERLPEMGARVMVGHAVDGWVGIGERVLTGTYLHWEDDGEDLHDPTHWMPLPEPPIVIDDEVRALHEVARQIAKTQHHEQTLGDVLFKRQPEPPEVK